MAFISESSLAESSSSQSTPAELLESTLSESTPIESTPLDLPLSALPSYPIPDTLLNALFPPLTSSKALLLEATPLLFAGFCMSLLLCAGLIFCTKRFNLFIDSHTSHKPQRFHTQATPRAGGIGIFVAFCMLMLWGYANGWLFFTQAWQMALFTIGGSVIFASGLIEDFSGRLSPKSRLIIQCVAIFTLLAGLDIYLVDLSLGFSMPYLIGLFFSTFALVGVSNAMNIIDGFNGLAAGVALFVLAGIMYVSAQVGDSEVLYCAIGLFIATLGFFALNFPYGKIFLGDGGAYFLGFMIGFLLVVLTQRHTDSVSAFFGLGLMIYPIWEVIFSMWRRKRERLKATIADNRHLHTLLYARVGHNAKTSLYMWLPSLGAVVYAVVFYQHTLWLIVGVGVFGLFYGLGYRILCRIVSESRS